MTEDGPVACAVASLRGISSWYVALTIACHLPLVDAVVALAVAVLSLQGVAEPEGPIAAHGG